MGFIAQPSKFPLLCELCKIPFHEALSLASLSSPVVVIKSGNDFLPLFGANLKWFSMTKHYRKGFDRKVAWLVWSDAYISPWCNYNTLLCYFLAFEVSDITIHRTSFIYAIKSFFFNNYYYLAKVGSFYILQFMSWWNGRRREEGRREQRLWRTIREEVHFRRPLSTDKKSAHKIVVRNCVDFDKAF